MVNLKKVFFALSNENRIKIYKYVLKKESNIRNLENELGIKYANLLTHIKVLKDAGMISTEKNITKEYQETLVKGIPFKEGSLKEGVYQEILKENK